MAETRRISQTLIKPLRPSPEETLSQGFRAELPGWDLATLLQMACARGGRSCVEIRSGNQVGYVYMSDGRIIHASMGTQLGEPAVIAMLSWPGGAFALCDRPWPLKPSVNETPEVILLRAAQAQDEAQRHAGRATPARLAIAPEGTAVLASVRIDINGELVAREGAADTLAPLLGYVTRMGALLGVQLGLQPFEALAVELGKKRALIYVEGDEMVGLMLAPGTLYQELRQQLGV